MRIGRTLPPAAAPIEWKDLVSGIAGVLRGDRETDSLRKELQDVFGQRFCFLASSGKAALTIILLALKELRPERSKVLIPAFTCYSVPSAIVRAGLQVALCDIDPATFDFDYQDLQKKIDDPGLLGVIPVHLFGLSADVKRLQGVLADRSVYIIEDAAQAMGGEQEGKFLGTQGDVGFFSLGRGKALSAVEGGIIITNSTEIGTAIAGKMEELDPYSLLETATLFLYALALSILARPALFWIPKGMPYLRLGETLFDPTFRMRRMSSMQAGMLRNWQGKLRRLHESRRISVRNWSLPESVVSPVRVDSSIPPLLRYPVMLSSQEAVRRILKKSEQMGLGIAKTYPESIHKLPELSGSFNDEEYPNASHVAKRTVTLPVHAWVTQEHLGKIEDLFSQTEES